MDSVLDNQKPLKKHFPDHYIQSWRKFKDFSGLAQEFKHFSSKNGIQGLFKDFPQNSRTFQDCVDPVDVCLREIPIL